MKITIDYQELLELEQKLLPITCHCIGLPFGHHHTGCIYLDRKRLQYELNKLKDAPNESNECPQTNNSDTL